MGLPGSHNLHQQSVIYYLDLRCGGAVDPWARPSSGSVAVLLFGTAALAYVAGALVVVVGGGGEGICWMGSFRWDSSSWVQG